MTTKQAPVAGPSTVSPSRDGQEVAGEQDGTSTPSERPAEATKKGKKKGTSRMVRRARVERWNRWCEERKWISQDDPSYKQIVGDIVAHRSDGEHSSVSRHSDRASIPFS